MYTCTVLGTVYTVKICTDVQKGTPPTSPPPPPPPYNITQKQQQQHTRDPPPPANPSVHNTRKRNANGYIMRVYTGRRANSVRRMLLSMLLCAPTHTQHMHQTTTIAYEQSSKRMRIWFWLCYSRRNSHICFHCVCMRKCVCVCVIHNKITWPTTSSLPLLSRCRLHKDVHALAQFEGRLYGLWRATRVRITHHTHVQI